MDDYIRREDARKLLEEITWGKSRRQAMDELLKIPSADVVPTKWIRDMAKHMEEKS